MTDAQLKPCPFCGCANVKSGGDDKFVGAWCLNCGCIGPNHYDCRFDWNTRADLSPSVKPLEGQTELLEALISQVLLSGNGYIEAVGTDGWPRELHVLRSDRMEVVPGPDGWPAAFDYSVTQRSSNLSTDKEE